MEMSCGKVKVCAEPSLRVAYAWGSGAIYGHRKALEVGMFGRWAEGLKGQKAEGWEQRGEGHYQSYPRRVGPPARMEGYQHAGGRSHSSRVA